MPRLVDIHNDQHPAGEVLKPGYIPATAAGLTGFIYWAANAIAAHTQELSQVAHSQFLEHAPALTQAAHLLINSIAQ